MTAQPLPRHVAFIMDGNGRWAEARGLPRPLGHQAGAETVRRVVTFARKRGLACLTLYAFSTENWARPRAEVDALMHLFAAFVDSELPALRENGIRLKILGDMSALSSGLRDKLRQAEAETAGNAAMILALAVNYGGRDEIARAARAAACAIAAEGGDPANLDATALAARLDTFGLPDPDLVVRTAGEMRLSNFLLWQAAYAELYFTQRTWPDFSDADFEEALAVYAARTRKFGG